MLMVLIWGYTLRITEVEGEVDGHHSLLEPSIIYCLKALSLHLLVVFLEIILIQENG